MSHICWILQLISLTPFICGTFVVDVTESSYQAEENHDITLEWTFTATAHMSVTSVYILCQMLTEDKDPVLFHLHEGVEVPESQDKQFSGRVQVDKDVIREGRIRLHVSRLRTEDSGLYWCDVQTDDGSSGDKCQLNVTAAVDKTKTRRIGESQVPEGPEPKSQGRSSDCAGPGLTTAVAVALLVKLCFT